MFRSLLLMALFTPAVPAPAGAMADPASLRGRVEAFAGQAVAVDPRLRMPDCPQLRLAWRDERQSAVTATCEAPRWRMLFPVGGAVGQQAPEQRNITPAVRRGDPVQVLVEGAGFRLVADGVAGGAARAGERVVVRNLKTGRLLVAMVGDDGILRLAGK